MQMPEELDNNLIAPCGVNCATCMAYLRNRNKCYGCNGNNDNKPYHCIKCRVKLCEKRLDNQYQYCYQCEKKCQRLKLLDKRYIKNYQVSLLENLDMIKKNGLDKFLEMEKNRWTCAYCGGVICQHTGVCSECKKLIMED